MPNTVKPYDALQRLIEGNQKYAADLARSDHAHAIHRRHAIAEQRPFGVVLGCSDSRVPVEIIFDQTLGNLFVIRVAGYVLSDHVIGSIEYAVQTFGSSLVMVLGHSHCGAVTATVEAVLEDKPVPVGSRVSAIVESIRPAVESVRTEPNVLEAAIKAHVRAVTQELQNDNGLKASIDAGKLAVVGAEYHLGTGMVQIVTSGAPTPPQQSTAPAAE